MCVCVLCVRVRTVCACAYCVCVCVLCVRTVCAYCVFVCVLWVRVRTVCACVLCVRAYCVCVRTVCACVLCVRAYCVCVRTVCASVLCVHAYCMYVCMYVLYVYKLCWNIVACSERDMAYATILVRFVYFMWCSDSFPYEWDMAVPLSLYMFCVLTGVCVV